MVDLLRWPAEVAAHGSGKFGDRAVEPDDLDPLRVAFCVEGGDAGALGAVGRGDTVPDEGVEQRRLAGADASDERDGQRFGESGPQGGNRRRVRRQRAHLVEQLLHATTHGHALLHEI